MAGKKKSAQQGNKAAAKPGTTSISPDLMNNSEIDPDLVHPKWGQALKEPAAKAKSQSKQQQESSKSSVRPEKQPQSQPHSEPKRGKGKRLPPFAFLTTPYPNPNVLVTDGNQVTRLNENGSNIVYFDRCLSNDTLSLRVESFSQPEAINMTFGVTTCNVKNITAHKFHVKSFCTSDGRPCGGKSLICKLDRKVSGAEVISFKKVPEGINFLSDGFLVCQFKDKESIFKNKQAFPFIALTGDVESVRIVDPAHPGSGRNSAMSKRSRRESVLSDTLISRSNTPAVDQKAAVVSQSRQNQGAVHSDDANDGFEEISNRKKKKLVDPSDRYTFITPPYMNTKVMEIRDKGRLVIRKSYSPNDFYAVYMNRDLSMDRRLALQVEKINNTETTPNCFTIGISTCGPETVKHFDCHSYRTCWVKSECGGLSTSFNIHKAKSNSQSGTVVTMERTGSGVLIGAGDWFRTHLTDNMVLFSGREVYPFILMNGSVCAIRIIEDPERFSAPLPAIPRPLPTAAIAGNNSDTGSVLNPDEHYDADHSFGRRDSVSSLTDPGPLRFIVPPHASGNMKLSNKKQTVTRLDLKGTRIVMMNRPLEIGQKFMLRVDKSTTVHENSPSFMFCLTTCNLSSLEKIRQHGSAKCGDGIGCTGQAITRSITSFAGTSTRILIQREPLSINVVAQKGLELREMFIDLGKVQNVRFFYPYLMLSGNAAAISIVDEPDMMQVTSFGVSDIAQPRPIPDPSPSFDRAVRRPEPRVTAVRPNSFPNSHESPVSSDLPSETGDSFSGFNVNRILGDGNSDDEEHDPHSNFPGVNGYSDAHYDCVTPTDWDNSNCSGDEGDPISVAFSTASHSNPVTFHHHPSQQPVSALPCLSRTSAHVPASNSQNSAQSSPLIPRPNRTASIFIPRKWFSNYNVRCSDSLISRIRSPYERNYIFSSEMRIGEKITFKLAQEENNLPDGVLIFGLTTTPILQIDFPSLPPDVCQLRQHPDHGTKWFTSPNLYHKIGISDGMTVMRNENGIVLTLAEEGFDDEEELIPGISSSAIVHPFFLMSGRVCSLQLETSVRPLCFQDQVRLYLIFFYLSLMNRCALRK